MKMQFNVLGARKFNDTVEGTKYDFTKLIVAMDMPEGPNAKGQNTIDMPYGDHTNYEQFANVNFPCQMELDVNATTKGFECLSAKPLVAQRPVAAAAA